MHVQMQDSAESPVPEPKRRAPLTLPRKGALIAVQAPQKSDAKSDESNEGRAGGLFSPYAFQRVRRFAKSRSTKHYKQF